MTMVEFLTFVVAVALASAFVILLLTKLGCIEWLQIHGDRYLSEWASCQFCQSFWVCTLLFIGVVCVYDEPLMIFGGVFSCPITRMLL